MFNWVAIENLKRKMFMLTSFSSIEKQYKIEFKKKKVYSRY
jgi:hypothetical protein